MSKIFERLVYILKHLQDARDEPNIIYIYKNIFPSIGKDSFYYHGAAIWNSYLQICVVLIAFQILRLQRNVFLALFCFFSLYFCVSYCCCVVYFVYLRSSPVCGCFVRINLLCLVFLQSSSCLVLCYI